VELFRTPGRMLQGLVLAIDFLKSGGKLGQRALKRISSAHPDLDIPSWNAVANKIKNTPGATRGSGTTRPSGGTSANHPATS